MTSLWHGDDPPRPYPYPGREQDPLHSQTIEAYPERANLYRLGLVPEPDWLYLTKKARGTKIEEIISFERTDGATLCEPTISYVRRALHTALSHWDCHTNALA